MADKKNVTPETVTLEVGANEAVPTTFGVESYGRRRAFVTSFTGAGELQSAPSETPADFKTVSTDADTPLQLHLSAEAFVRLTAAGDINFVFL